MMWRLLLILVPACAFAEMGARNAALLGSAQADWPVNPILLSVDFEETGTPSPAPSATSGTPNYDYATAPAPLAGSESLQCLNSYAEWTIPEQSELCASFIFYQSGADAAITELTLRSGSGTQGTMLNVTGPDRFRFVHGATTINQNATAYGAVHYLWIRYVAETVPGSSADGITQVWTNSTATFSTASQIINNSSGTGDAVTVVRLNGNDATVFAVYDNVVISTSTNTW